MNAQVKRKEYPESMGDSSPLAKRRFEDTGTSTTAGASIPASLSDTTQSDNDKSQSSRLERFQALKARHSQSRNQNRKATAIETQHSATDPDLLQRLSRKQAIASQKLLKADSEAAGEDFERKRAWDWTIEESERWDKRMEKKEKHRENVAFQDYRQDARKIYKKQMRELKPDMVEYEKQKVQAVQRAADSGGLEVVETDDGELVAVDKDGVFYSTSNSTDFVQNRPGKAAVDRLVEDLRKAEETRLRKRKERGRNDDDADVTYINDKNKQFNQKLARFYNVSTACCPHTEAVILTVPRNIRRRSGIVSSAGPQYEEDHNISIEFPSYHYANCK